MHMCVPRASYGQDISSEKNHKKLVIDVDRTGLMTTLLYF